MGTSAGPPRGGGPAWERPGARAWLASSPSRPPLRQLEHPHHAALLQEADLLGHLAAPQRHRTAPAGDDAHVLLAPLLPGDRRRDDAGAGLELPDHLAGLR